MNRIWTAGLVVAAAMTARADAPAPESLTVIVLNQAAVPERSLTQMFRDLDEILAPAGIRATITVCPTSLDLPRPAICSESPRPERLVLQLLPGQPVQRVHSVGTTTFNRETGIASIRLFSDLAKSLAADSGWAWPELLAHLAAHEIGHVLLDTDGHTRNGIMRPVWSSNELSTLRHAQAMFDSQQGTTMRQALSARGLMAQARGLTR